MKPKVGSKIYVRSHFCISRGGDDVVGGLATVTRVYEDISGGEKHVFVEVAEHPGNGYNWSQFLEKEQDKLKKQFGESVAHPDPDVDTPWIQDGDWVDGKVYHGKPIW